MAKTDQDTGKKFGRILRGAVQSVLSVAMATTLTSVNPGHSFYSQTSAPAKNPAPTPTTTQPKPDAPVYGPDVDFYKLPLSYDWATQQKIKNHPRDRAHNTTAPIIISTSYDNNGQKVPRQRGDNRGNNKEKLYDIASVAKIISIVLLDDLHKKGVIDINKPIDRDIAVEYGLHEQTTYRDAIAAAYINSNNYAIQTAMKSAIRADMKLPHDQPVSNAMVGEYLLRSLKKEGLEKSVLANAAGYPINSDEFSAAFSDPQWPTRFNKFDPDEVADFMGHKICQNRLSSPIEALLNIKKGIPSLTKPIDYNNSTILMPSGLATTSQQTLNTADTRFIMAKTGTSDEANAALVITRDTKNNCQITLGAGIVPDRNEKIPEIAKQNKRPAPKM